jgi:hypothetical protein
LWNRSPAKALVDIWRPTRPEISRLSRWGRGRWKYVMLADEQCLAFGFC